MIRLAHRFLPLLAALGFALANVCVANAQSNDETSGSSTLFIGTYTGGMSKGIYRSQFDLASGMLEKPTLVAEIVNPSFLCLHPKLDVLYAVSEVPDGDRQITAFGIQSDGSLQELGHLSTAGNGPCFVSTDHDGKFVFVANYGSGSVCCISTNARGNLETVVSKQQHSGSSVNPHRQIGPHAHCILADPSNNFVCVTDLGLDQVLTYRFANGSLKRTSTHKCTPGHGPRHMAFHPDGKHAFVIHELTCKLSLCEWDSEDGTLTKVEEVSTLPGEFQQGYSTAEVLVHPNGKLVFGSNRGHDSIAAFAFSEGKLLPLGHTHTGGQTPRNFRIDPSGNFLLAENQKSNSIVVFRIDQHNGTLTQVGEPTEVGSPVSIKFWKPRQ